MNYKIITQKEIETLIKNKGETILFKNYCFKNIDFRSLDIKGCIFENKCFDYNKKVKKEELLIKFNG